MGRHGGINILHQKSWHVWRMDNRLRVERDELQHAQREAERLKAERKEAFDSKLRKLRRRAGGEPAITEEPEPTPSVPAAPSRQERRDEGDAYGKYGVTKSGLKEAEKDLDNSLRGRGPAQGRSYWGKEGLGSGPHINLFEEAELEVKRQDAAHTKLLRYQQTNNNLAEKGKKRPLSEFDEMAQETPWYLQVQKRPATDEDCEDAKLRRKWSRKNDQLMLEVLPKRTTQASEGSGTVPALREGPEDSPDDPLPLLGEAAHRKKGGKKEAKDKTQRRKEKERKKEGGDDEVLAQLRKERELREAAERLRAAELRPLRSR